MQKSKITCRILSNSFRILKGKKGLCKIFYYKKYHFNEKTGELTLSYAVGDYTFQEHIFFPKAPFVLSDMQKEALETVFFYVSIAVGISYYKAFLPPEIRLEQGQLTRKEAAFFERFYLNGLGEFAVRNQLNLQGYIHFPIARDHERTTIPLDLSRRTLVPVGGGKDSCVTLSLLHEMNIPLAAISVGMARPIEECIQIAEIPSFCLRRILDPQLISLNKTGRIYNGHIPITGVLAFILWAAAILYDYRFVAMSCERSANSGNLMQGKLLINHQYSKSLDFERDFLDITRHLTPQFRYFSLLRPLSEVHIAQLFANRCQAFFSAFTSCNKAFRLDPTKRLDRWCGACDKCRFVFLILAPFMARETLIRVVGENPLDDPKQIEGYQELLGLSGHKPFECVGEVEECRWAFLQLVSRPEWQHDCVIQTLKSALKNTSFNPLIPSNNHLIPKDFLNVMELF